MSIRRCEKTEEENGD
nr:intracellular viral protein [Vaccinia virus]WGO02289.1 intracellular viral protein [Vaccinia virus]WGO02517.1 intracellular viral protein [Vaccinia virus]WOG35594.1 intracellular viral protein [Vaccinia virus]WOG35822.1 intracellular viral protein [Vaccinia virus]